MAGSGIRFGTGHVLDERYLLEQVIGQGGMGTVFSARHLELDERVAVKVLQSESSFDTLEAEHLERFMREARLAAKLKNEHVVRVIDVARGKNGAPPYIVMELLEGVDLGTLVEARGRLPVPEAVGYILQACEAIAEAHALGITHRDLKSSNLHLSQRSDGTGLVKVVDFGISKFHDDASDPHLTATSSVFGSPAYMSPEQIRSAKHVDGRTDVWALAAVFYELVTAQLPFAGTTPADMLSNITSAPHIPLRKFAPDVPEGLELVIRAAFVKDREKRTPTVAAFAAALAPFGDASCAARVATIERIASRPRGVDGAALRSGVVAAPAVGIDDTVRAAPVAVAEPVSAPRGELSRTDRALVVGTDAKKRNGAFSAIVSGGIALTLLAAVAIAALVKSRVAPASRDVVGAEAPPPVEPPASVVVPVPAAEPTTDSPAASGITPPRPVARPTRPRPAHPSASAKPGHGAIDFSQRE